MAKKKVNEETVQPVDPSSDPLQGKEIVSNESIPEIKDEPVKDLKSSGLNKDIENMLSGYRQELQVTDDPQPVKNKRSRKKKEPEPEPEPQAMPPMISGALLILMIDLIIPNVIALANNKLSKEKIKASDLQLETKQKNELEPIADEVAKTIQSFGSPLTVLIVTLLGIYGVNLMALKTK